MLLAPVKECIAILAYMNRSASFADTRMYDWYALQLQEPLDEIVSATFAATDSDTWCALLWEIFRSFSTGIAEGSIRDTFPTKLMMLNLLWARLVNVHDLVRTLLDTPGRHEAAKAKLDSEEVSPSSLPYFFNDSC
jgi:hypothetical protein